MAQVDQREIGEFQMIGDLESESALVIVDRFRIVENADHRMDRFCHSVQLLQISDDGGADLGPGLTVGHD
jgi:hypothetical protein